MNFKNMYYYYFYENKKSLSIFYGVIVGIYLLFIATYINFNRESSIGGMEMSSIIFLFIVGLNSFKSNFHFGLTNGVSRKTLFLSFALTCISLGAFMAVVDMIITSVVSLVVVPHTWYLEAYKEGYYRIASQLSFMDHVQIRTTQFLWYTLLNAMVAMLGYCINLIYYRSNLIMKWIVSVIPFLFMFFVIPYVDQITQGAFTKFIGDFISGFFGFAGQTANPWLAMLNFLLGFAVLSGLSYLLIRRAVIKQ